jgi:hypothetical protein
MTKPKSSVRHETLTLKQLHEKIDADWQVKLKMQEDNRAAYPCIPHNSQKMYQISEKIRNDERRIDEFMG